MPSLSIQSLLRIYKERRKETTKRAEMYNAMTSIMYSGGVVSPPSEGFTGAAK